MTNGERFGRTLSAWLEEDAQHRVPAHLNEVLVRTAATRQRPWWSSLERLFPMTTTTLGGRVAARTPYLLLALVALLLVAMVGAAMLAGRQSAPISTGPASNGRIVAVDGTDLVSWAPDGTDRQVLLPLGRSAIPTLAMSPDGTRVAFAATNPVGVQVVKLADQSTSTIPVPGATDVAYEPMSWSPDGRSLAFTALVNGHNDLIVAAADGSGVRSLLPQLTGIGDMIWGPSFSPDGRWITFAGQRDGIAFTQLFVVHPDGTGLKALDSRAVETGDAGGPVWSPDASVNRIAYEVLENGALVLHVFDLDTDSDLTAGPGFWPSWSPDGSRISGCCATVWTTDSILAARPTSTTVFAQPKGRTCGDNLEATGTAICTEAIWSPDGTWLLAGDIGGNGLLMARADGTGEPVFIKPDAKVVGSAALLAAAWQPTWP